MKILDKSYDEKTILKYANTMETVNSARRIQLLEGKAKGTEVIEVFCSGGLELLIMIDRGLDIAVARYKGVNIGLLTKNGITGKAEVNTHEDEFLRYFTGGLLTTCGLRNAGSSCRDENGEYHPIHGRINTIGAQGVSIQWKTKEILEISGVMHETALFGNQLKLTRKITVFTSESRVQVNDTLENESVRDEEIMLLYHCNFGFPFLQEGCKLEFEAQDEVIPRTEEARKGMNEYREISAPIDDYKEQVFFHIQKGDAAGNGHVKVMNPHLNLAVELSYSLDNLPVLAHWKSMASGDYALGLEPSNNYIKGRVDERKNGTLKKIAPYSSLEFAIEFKIKEN
jgi:hypothetical protein